MTTGDPRSTRAWRKLRDQVVSQQPDCQLRLPGCTGASVTADHILTVRERPDLAMDISNHRGSCKNCNDIRGSMPNESLILGADTDYRPRALDLFKPLA